MCNDLGCRRQHLVGYTSRRGNTGRCVHRSPDRRAALGRQWPRAGSSSSEADAPGLSPHEPCLASAQGRELVIALSLRVVWWSVIWGTCIVHTCQVQTKWFASKRMPSSWTQVSEQSHLTDMQASTLWNYLDLLLNTIGEWILEHDRT
jgi:hypothetical protein